ncbi:MAG: glycosyltransferase family 4 protein [Myxococcota bacterium]
MGRAAQERASQGWDVLHIVTSLELGGAQLATLYEVEHTRLVRGRHLAFGPGGLLELEARSLAGVTCHKIPTLLREVAPLFDAQALLGLVRLVRTLRRAGAGRRLLVHTHSSKAGILGRWAAFLGGADLVVHSIHGFGHPHHGPSLTRRVLRLAEQLTAFVTDGFTADSAANIRDGRRDRLVRRQPATVVRCGIDVDELTRRPKAREQLRTTLGIAPREAVVLSVACLKPQKDPLTLVRVAEQVLRVRPTTWFLLAGDGELRAASESLARDLGIAERVRFLGWRRDIAELMQASDVLLLTSRWEGLPQVLPQAMAAGLAVVATSVDGNPEAIEHEHNGLLCQSGDVPALARATLRLLGDRALRQAFVRVGKERVAAFSREQMVRDLDAFYARLVDEGVSRAPVRRLLLRLLPRLLDESVA